MRLPHNSNNLAYVRSLRKNMTDAERKLWYEYLRPCPYKFTRQKSVGPYILDFYCASAQSVLSALLAWHLPHLARCIGT